MFCDRTLFSHSFRSRKEKFLSLHRVPSPDPPAVPQHVKEVHNIVVSDAISHGSKHLPVLSIVQGKASQDNSTKFRLHARVKDFYPLDIRDFSIRVCTNCQKP
jgi:hypothetical protein